MARRLGREHLATMKELCTDSVVASAAEQFILNYARSCDLQKTEVPRKVKLCHEEWTPDTGLVTPTLKLCRKPLQKYYERDINALYESEEESVMPLIDHPE
uniref:Long-chain acyl-CoA synthetase n=1 Tax=Rhipicephalus zambeziensis TaxID=60191 RepID=A0A224Z3P2_9ACAR